MLIGSLALAAVLVAGAAVNPVAAVAEAPIAATVATCQQRLTLGWSREGRRIVACQVRGSSASAPSTLLVVGSMHGNEKGGLKVTSRLRAMDLSGKGADIWTITTINPDGHVRNRRGNLRRIDLNGNFPTSGWEVRYPGLVTYGGPHAASEPETRALMKGMTTIRPDKVVIFHQRINAIDCPPYRKRTMTTRLHQLTGYRIKCLPVEHGNFTAWANARYSWTTAVTFELDASPPASRMDRVAKGLVALAGG